jgi:hypothetical protein
MIQTSRYQYKLITVYLRQVQRDEDYIKCKTANESANNAAGQPRYSTPAPMTEDDPPVERGTEPEEVFVPLLKLEFELLVLVVLTNSK